MKLQLVWWFSTQTSDSVVAFHTDNKSLEVHLKYKPNYEMKLTPETYFIRSFIPSLFHHYKDKLWGKHQVISCFVTLRIKQWSQQCRSWVEMQMWDCEVVNLQLLNKPAHPAALTLTHRWECEVFLLTVSGQLMQGIFACSLNRCMSKKMSRAMKNHSVTTSKYWKACQLGQPRARWTHRKAMSRASWEKSNQKKQRHRVSPNILNLNVVLYFPFVSTSVESNQHIVTDVLYFYSLYQPHIQW